MKRRHTIDKFGRMLAHSFKLNEEAGHIDVGNRRLRFVADPVDSHETVNKGFLDKRYIPLEQRVQNLENMIRQTPSLAIGAASGASECLSLSGDKKSWDARGLRIVNVGAAEQMEDASRLSQTCTFDEKAKKFKVGTVYFDLVETTSTKPVVVATRYTTHSPLEFTAYQKPNKALIPTYSARWKPDDKKMVDYKNLEIVWDEQSKKFSYRSEMKNW